MEERSNINKVNGGHSNSVREQGSLEVTQLPPVHNGTGGAVITRGGAAAGLSPMERINWILSDVSPGAVVEKMPVQDLFSLVKDAGLEDASEIVALASPEQFQGFIDLDGWQKDLVALQDTASWIRALVLGGCEDVGARLTGLDKEYLDSFLGRIIRVWDLNDSLEEANLPEGDRLLMTTYDQAFAVELLDPDYVDVAKVALDSITMSKGPLWLSKYLAGLRWELLSETDESAYRWRRGRMEDLGFPDYHRALEVLRGLPVDSPGLGGLKARIGELRTGGSGGDGGSGEVLLGPPPRYLAEQMGADGLLEQGLGLISDHQARDRAVQGLARLFNWIMVAKGVDPGEMDEVQAVLRLAKSYLNLGLEALVGNEPEVVARVLGEGVLVEVFRVGLGMVEALVQSARALARQMESPGEGPWEFQVPGLEAEQAELLYYLQEIDPIALGGQYFSSMAAVEEAYELFRDIESLLPGD